MGGGFAGRRGFGAGRVERERGSGVNAIVKPRVLRVMLSSALYWAWIFLLYWSSALLGPSDDLFFAKGAAFCGSAVALGVWHLIVRRGRDSLAGSLAGRAAPYALTPLAGLGSFASCFAVLPLPALVALWFLAGYGAAFVLVRMAHAFRLLGKENALVAMFVSLFISCLTAVFTSALPAGGCAASLVMLALPLASCALASVVPAGSADSAQDGRSTAEAVDSEIPVPDQVAFGTKEARRAFVVYWVQLFFYSVVFSFALLVGLNIDGGGLPTVYVWLGVFLAGLLVMAYGMWLNARVGIDFVQFVLLGITVVCLAPFTLAGEAPVFTRYAACALLMFGFTSYDMFSLSQLLSMIEARNAPFYRYFALGRFANALGVFVGWVLAAIVFAVGTLFGGGLVARALPLALIVGLVLLIMACAYGGRTAEAAAKGAAAPSDPLGAWKRSCEQLCEEYALSSREREVFALCAKGRDSTYICNALYISAHTVKSHIYHIYGKMDIHSQQELISLVEERADDLRAEGR